MYVRSLSSVMLPAVALMLLVPVDLLAQDHIVSRTDFRSELRSAAAARQRDIAKLEKLLLSESGRQALASVKLDAGKVTKALPLLSDHELARLAAQADRAQADFAAGGISLTNQQVTYIIIGVIVIALVAIIAH